MSVIIMSFLNRWLQILTKLVILTLLNMEREETWDDSTLEVLELME